jgi:hypothetical protein
MTDHAEGTTNQWDYRVLRNTEMEELENWVNGLNADFGDIESAISVNDFHVWARQGRRRDGAWQHRHERWDANSSRNTTMGLNAGTRVVLGLSGQDFHYLEWHRF